MYRGRFAPSPTGPLHLGSLLTAVGSYLQAKSNKGIWLLRIEDIDPPREARGAADLILRDLDNFGFEWDGLTQYQSAQLYIYQDIVSDLIKNNQAYYCTCSRKKIAETGLRNKHGLIYPGFCRNKKWHQGAVRIRTRDENIVFNDGLQKTISQNIETEVGDYVIKRADDLFAYHIAVVVDDEYQQITEIVRGSDLHEITPRHIYLQKILNYATPRYIHLPIVTHSTGEKLSKQTGAKPLNKKSSVPQLCQVLTMLGQQPEDSLQYESLSNFWEWAIKNWNLQKIPATTSSR